MLSFTVQHQVEIYLAHFTSKSEGESYQKRVENGKNVNDPWQNIFRKERTTTYLEDVEDDTRRCPECNWELVGQQCVNCGEVYHDAPDDSEEGESVNTGDEEVESLMDANESDHDFIVDDDVVDYEDPDSADEILDADAGSDTEHDDEYVTPSRRRNRHTRQPAVVVDLSSDSDSESDSDDDDDDEENVSAMTTKRSAPIVSSDDDDFQLPLNRQKMQKTQETFKIRKRKVITLDDSDEDEVGHPEPSDSHAVSESSPDPTNGKKRIISSDEEEEEEEEEEESSQGSNKKRAIRDSSDDEQGNSEMDKRVDSSHEQDSDDDEDEDDDDDDDDLRQGLLELDEMVANRATSHTIGETTKVISKKSKKNKKHKNNKHKHNSKSDKQKGKGKAKA
ncbi:unnamed protein product [Umbelopsis ramanniana]